MSKRDALIEKRSFLDESEDIQMKIPSNVHKLPIDETIDETFIHSYDNQSENNVGTQYLPNNPLAMEVDASVLLNDTLIHLCLYRINHISCTIPFLQFVTEESDTNTFPSIENKFAVPNENLHVEIMNVCVGKILAMFPLIQDDYGVEMQQHMYKGFLHSETNNIVYMFFHIQTYEAKKNDPTITWSIIHEMTSKSDQWSPVVRNMFLDDLEMTKLYDGGLVIPSPYMMYGLSRNKMDQPYITTMRNVSMIDKTYQHPILGNHFYFCVDAIDDKPIDTQKYAVFTINDRYILRDISLCTKEALQTFMTKYQDLDIMSIYFYEEGKQLWCIKSPDHFARL